MISLQRPSPLLLNESGDDNEKKVNICILLYREPTHMALGWKLSEPSCVFYSYIQLKLFKL